MNDLSHTREYNNMFYGTESRPVSNVIKVTSHKVGTQGKCADWVNPYPLIVEAANIDGYATFFAGQIWDYDNYLDGKPHDGIVFTAKCDGDLYYAEKVIADY